MSEGRRRRPGAQRSGRETPGHYRVPVAAASAEVREKGSRFLAHLVAVDGEPAAKAALAELAARHPDATHHCFAWRLGWPPAERASDAGEPAGTAGRPILAVLAGAGLSDALLVVVRWFGGVKLGKGGLARAYAAAARGAVAAARVAERWPTARLVLVVPHSRLGAVRRLLRPPRIALLAEAGGAAAARLLLAVRSDAREELAAALAELGLAAEEQAP